MSTQPIVLPPKEKNVIFLQKWNQYSENQKAELMKRLHDKVHQDGDHLIVDKNEIRLDNYRYSVAQMYYMIYSNTTLPDNCRIRNTCCVTGCVSRDHICPITLGSNQKGLDGAQEHDWNHIMALIDKSITVVSSTPEERQLGNFTGDHYVTSYWRASTDNAFTQWRDKSVNIFRLIWAYHHNRAFPPDNLLVRHKCKHKGCCNINHMELGTPKNNGEDMVRDGTSPAGERNPGAKITQDIANKIRESKDQGTELQRSDFFGVSVNIVKNIDQGRCWNPAKTRVLKAKTRKSVKPTSVDYINWMVYIEGKCDKVPVEIDNPFYNHDNPLAREHWIPRLTPGRNGYCCSSICGVVMSFHDASLEASTEQPLTKGEICRHLCNNRTCCNPDHLLHGTRANNGADTAKAGSLKGEKHPNSKLTEKQVIEIKHLLRNGENSQKLTYGAIAAKYNVTPECIGSIKRGKTWDYVKI